MEPNAGTEMSSDADDATPVVVVFAYAYPSGTAALNEFKRFDKWSRKRRNEVSFWRTRSDDGKWCVVVAEDGAADAFREFPWRGVLTELPPLHVLAFVQRRLQWLATLQQNGRRGPAHDTFHYRHTTGPKLGSEGVWEISRDE